MGFEDFRWISFEHGILDLIVFALGYFFGGSRYDSNYLKKYFRQEDCSSAIAKWTGSEVPFTTYDIKHSAQSVFEVMTRLKEDRAPTAGDILCFGGHVCVVSSFVDHERPIEVISYNRLMPFF
ncbi:MAG: hypothetical protein SFT91_05850 [Rickettsiaceae bacterium]|nr:hypothetical protein [Rickettsiaceae bacterium]